MNPTNPLPSYKLVTASTREELECQVRYELAKGMIPSGSVAVSYVPVANWGRTEFKILFAQAVCDPRSLMTQVAAATKGMLAPRKRKARR